MAAPLTTIAEAVGSDVTNVVRTAVDQGRFGAAAHVFTSYLANDHCVAVSKYTKGVIVESAREVDERWGTSWAPVCEDRIRISYPAIDSSAYTCLDGEELERRLARRGLERDGYALFLSRLTRAKGVDDLVNAFAMSAASRRVKLVVCGTGPEAPALRALAASTPVADRIVFLDDVDDAEKPYLMAGSSAYVLPSKPRPEFVETFGIALAEKLLAGGGPVVTCATGGIPEAVGPHARIVPTSHPWSIAKALDGIVLGMSPAERQRGAAAGRAFAMQFDRAHVFDKLFAAVAPVAA
jgi:glycosyltransferase involved in cell wall biosynthesis